MSAIGSGGAAGAMGLVPTPIGTLEELRRENLNPALVGSCAPKNDALGVRGCQYYENCIFRLTKYGGFRGNGPRNCGVFLQTHEGMKVEMERSCFFVMSRLYDRMRAGERDRQDGKNGEIIQIVALEPSLGHPLSKEVIHKQKTVNIHEGKVPSQPHKFEKKTFTGPVSPFPRPGERHAVAYDTLLDDRRRAREAQDEDLQMGPIQRVQPDEVAQPVVNDAAPDPTPAAVPVAAPVRKKA